MLRTILEEDELVVQDVITQNSEKNLYGRSVRLDALCTLGNGEKCNIEIQRSDNDDHLRRVRYNASSITLRDSQIGTKFDKIQEVYVVFISEFDMFKMGKTVYHVDNVVRETKEILQDGLHRIFVNTEINDGTKTSRLMSHFIEKTVEDVEFPELSARMHELKEEEGGITVMSGVMEKYEKIAAEEATQRTKHQAIRDMLELGLTKEQILKKYSEEDFNEAVEEGKTVMV